MHYSCDYYLKFMKKLKIRRTLEQRSWVALDIGLKDGVLGCDLKGWGYAILRGNLKSV